MTNANLTHINVIKLGKASCRPCQILTHVLAEESEEFAALNVTIEDVDIENPEKVYANNTLNGPEMLAKFDTKASPITSVPVLVFERNGHEMARISGLAHIDEIYGAITHAKTAK